MQEELKRKDAESGRPKGQPRASEEERPPGGVRTTSTDVSRRLFVQGLADGNRTPPPPPPPDSGPSTHSAITSATGMTPGSMLIPGVATVPALPTVHHAHTRQNVGMLRPSARAVASASVPGLSRMPQPACHASGPPPSPQQHRSHVCAASREPAWSKEAAAAQVRTLVSEFERRSNSHGAPPRVRESSPRRHQVAQASHPLRPRAAVREDSREVPMVRLNSSRAQVEPVELDTSQPIACAGGEEAPMTHNMSFGMSPMSRQIQQQSVPTRALGTSSLSPSQRAPVSVQDRIRQFNPQGGRLVR